MISVFVRFSPTNLKYLAILTRGWAGIRLYSTAVKGYSSKLDYRPSGQRHQTRARTRRGGRRHRPTHRRLVQLRVHRDDSDGARSVLLEWWAKVEIILTWVGDLYFDKITKHALYGQTYRKLLDCVGRSLRCRGAAGAILFIKERRTRFHAFLAADKDKQESMIAGRFGRAWGVPFLKEVQKFGGRREIIGDPDRLRMIRMTLTVLSCLRGLKLPVQIDLKPMTEPFKGSEGLTTFGTILEEFGSWVPRFWKSLKVKQGAWALDPVEGGDPKLWFSRCHWSFKAGPNGPATLTALRDLMALRGQPIAESIKELGGSALRKRMELLEEVCMGPLSGLSIKVPSKKKTRMVPFSLLEGKGRLRVLRGIPDKEGKVRQMAIGDYWSQAALRPIHDAVFGILKTIPQDMTFRQDSFITRLDQLKIWDKGITFHSIDLSKATDRWPFPLMVELMEYVLGFERCQAWRLVMTALPFLIDPSHGEGGIGGERYSVGNPMGFYTSWACFALCHHAVLQWLWHLLKKKGQAPYVVLGDDVLIWDDDLAERYKGFLAVCGVEWSREKTMSSPDALEFAKRILYRGVEVTPFPTAAILGSLGSSVLLGAVLVSETRKGLVPAGGIPAAVRRLAGRLHPSMPGSVRRRWGRFASHMEALFRVTSGGISMDDGVRAILSRDPVLSGRPILFEDGVGSRLYREAVVRVFCDSLEVKGAAQKGTLSVSEVTRHMAGLKLPELIAWTKERAKAGRPIKGGAATVVKALPFIDALRGVGGSVMSILDELPTEETVIGLWPELVRVMTYNDEVAWGHSPENLSRICQGVLVAKAILDLAKDPNLLEVRAARPPSMGKYLRRLPVEWMFEEPFGL